MVFVGNALDKLPTQFLLARRKKTPTSWFSWSQSIYEPKNEKEFVRKNERIKDVEKRKKDLEKTIVS